MEKVATRGQILWLKCNKFDFGWGSAPDPSGGAHSAPPDPLFVLCNTLQYTILSNNFWSCICGSIVPPSQFPPYCSSEQTDRCVYLRHVYDHALAWHYTKKRSGSGKYITYTHWRRQLWGTGARAPLDFQHSYFVRKQIRKMYKNNAILRNFYQFLAHFCHFFCHSFPQGVIIVPKMPERSPINFNSTRFR